MNECKIGKYRLKCKIAQYMLNRANTKSREHLVALAGQYKTGKIEQYMSNRANTKINAAENTTLAALEGQYKTGSGKFVVSCKICNIVRSDSASSRYLRRVPVPSSESTAFTSRPFDDRIAGWNQSALPQGAISIYRL